MKSFVLLMAVAAAAALVTAPADAAAKKRKKVTAPRAPVTTPHVRRNAVYDSDGTILGVDPDPFIRLMIRRDPRPWDGDP